MSLLLQPRYDAISPISYSHSRLFCSPRPSVLTSPDISNRRIVHAFAACIPGASALYGSQTLHLRSDDAFFGAVQLGSLRDPFAKFITTSTLLYLFIDAWRFPKAVCAKTLAWCHMYSVEIPHTTLTYHPLFASFSPSPSFSTVNPTIASPRSVLTSANTLGSRK